MPIRPRYAEKFRCIAADCEDNCCRGWAMVVDQSSYEKYQQVPALSSTLDQTILPLTKDRSPSRYAMIQTNADATCPFLGTDRICSLHKQYGPEFLCQTCATYPRAMKKANEHALLLSCPEAARIVLLDEDLLPGLPVSYSRFLIIPDHQAAGPAALDEELRELTFLLLRDRSYTLWQRLYLLGMLTRQLEQIEENSNLVPSLLREFSHTLVQGSLRPEMDSIPARPAVQLKILIDVISQSLIHTNPSLCSLHDCLAIFSEGLSLDSCPDLEAAGVHYAAAYENHLEPFLRRRPHLLENYLINQACAIGFPVVRAELHKNFLWMCVEFFLVKGLLTGMAGYYRENFALEHVIKLVQSSSKAVEHQPAFRDAVNWEGIADQEVLAVLLKNDARSETLAHSGSDELSERRTMLEPVA